MNIKLVLNNVYNQCTFMTGRGQFLTIMKYSIYCISVAIQDQNELIQSLTVQVTHWLEYFGSLRPLISF